VLTVAPASLLCPCIPEAKRRSLRAAAHARSQLARLAPTCHARTAYPHARCSLKPSSCMRRDRRSGPRSRCCSAWSSSTPPTWAPPPGSPQCSAPARLPTCGRRRSRPSSTATSARAARQPRASHGMPRLPHTSCSVRCCSACPPAPGGAAACRDWARRAQTRRTWRAASARRTSCSRCCCSRPSPRMPHGGSHC